MKNPHLDDFCQFWIDNFRSDVPRLPKKPNDLSITEQEILRSHNKGKLYQNLFKTDVDSGMLPADLEQRVRKGLLWMEDRDRLRKFGYEHEAQKIDDALVQHQQQRIEEEIAASKQRQEAQRKKQEEFANKPLGERMMSEPLSMGQIIDNRMKYHGKV